MFLLTDANVISDLLIVLLPVPFEPEMTVIPSNSMSANDMRATFRTVSFMFPLILLQVHQSAMHHIIISTKTNYIICGGAASMVCLTV